MVNDDGVMSENCAYTFDVAFSKTAICVLVCGKRKIAITAVFATSQNSALIARSKTRIELVYESVDSQRLYRSAFMQNSENCSDCFSVLI